MQVGDTKLNRLEARHPGLIAKIEAMFDNFATVAAVTAMVRAEYGEPVAVSTIGNHRNRVWKVRRDRGLKENARRVARQEFLREGRS
jgi:hypothetical protein